MMRVVLATCFFLWIPSTVAFGQVDSTGYDTALRSFQYNALRNGRYMKRLFESKGCCYVYHRNTQGSSNLKAWFYLGVGNTKIIDLSIRTGSKAGAGSRSPWFSKSGQSNLEDDEIASVKKALHAYRKLHLKDKRRYPLSSSLWVHAASFGRGTLASVGKSVARFFPKKWMLIHERNRKVRVLSFPFESVYALQKNKLPQLLQMYREDLTAYLSGKDKECNKKKLKILGVAQDNGLFVFTLGDSPQVLHAQKKQCKLRKIEDLHGTRLESLKNQKQWDWIADLSSQAFLQYPNNLSPLKWLIFPTQRKVPKLPRFEAIAKVEAIAEVRSNSGKNSYYAIVKTKSKVNKAIAITAKPVEGLEKLMFPDPIDASARKALNDMAANGKSQFLHSVCDAGYVFRKESQPLTIGAIPADRKLLVVKFQWAKSDKVKHRGGTVSQLLLSAPSNNKSNITCSILKGFWQTSKQVNFPQPDVTYHVVARDENNSVLLMGLPSQKTANRTSRGEARQLSFAILKPARTSADEDITMIESRTGENTLQRPVLSFLKKAFQVGTHYEKLYPLIFALVDKNQKQTQESLILDGGNVLSWQIPQAKKRLMSKGEENSQKDVGNKGRAILSFFNGGAPQLYSFLLSEDRKVQHKRLVPELYGRNVKGKKQWLTNIRRFSKSIILGDPDKGYLLHILDVRRELSKPKELLLGTEDETDSSKAKNTKKEHFHLWYVDLGKTGKQAKHLTQKPISTSTIKYFDSLEHKQNSIVDKLQGLRNNTNKKECVPQIEWGNHLGFFYKLSKRKGCFSRQGSCKSQCKKGFGKKPLQRPPSLHQPIHFDLELAASTTPSPRPSPSRRKKRKVIDSFSRNMALVHRLIQESVKKSVDIKHHCTLGPYWYASMDNKVYRLLYQESSNNFGKPKLVSDGSLLTGHCDKKDNVFAFQSKSNLYKVEVLKNFHRRTKIDNFAAKSLGFCSGSKNLSARELWRRYLRGWNGTSKVESGSTVELKESLCNIAVDRKKASLVTYLFKNKKKKSDSDLYWKEGTKIHEMVEIFDSKRGRRVIGLPTRLSTKKYSLLHKLRTQRFIKMTSEGKSQFQLLEINLLEKKIKVGSTFYSQQVGSFLARAKSSALSNSLMNRMSSWKNYPLQVKTHSSQTFLYEKFGSGKGQHWLQLVQSGTKPKVKGLVLPKSNQNRIELRCKAKQLSFLNGMASLFEQEGSATSFKAVTVLDVGKIASKVIFLLRIGNQITLNQKEYRLDEKNLKKRAILSKFVAFFLNSLSPKHGIALKELKGGKPYCISKDSFFLKGGLGYGIVEQTVPGKPSTSFGGGTAVRLVTENKALRFHYKGKKAEAIKKSCNDYGGFGRASLARLKKDITVRIRCKIKKHWFGIVENAKNSPKGRILGFKKGSRSWTTIPGFVQARQSKAGTWDCGSNDVVFPFQGKKAGESFAKYSLNKKKMFEVTELRSKCLSQSNLNSQLNSAALELWSSSFPEARSIILKPNLCLKGASGIGGYGVRVVADSDPKGYRWWNSGRVREMKITPSGSFIGKMKYLLTLNMTPKRHILYKNSFAKIATLVFPKSKSEAVGLNIHSPKKEQRKQIATLFQFFKKTNKLRGYDIARGVPRTLLALIFKNKKPEFKVGEDWLKWSKNNLEQFVLLQKSAPRTTDYTSAKVFQIRKPEYRAFSKKVGNKKGAKPTIDYIKQLGGKISGSQNSQIGLFDAVIKKKPQESSFFIQVANKMHMFHNTKGSSEKAWRDVGRSRACSKKNLQSYIKPLKDGLGETGFNHIYQYRSLRWCNSTAIVTSTKIGRWQGIGRRNGKVVSFNYTLEHTPKKSKKPKKKRTTPTPKRGARLDFNGPTRRTLARLHLFVKPETGSSSVNKKILLFDTGLVYASSNKKNTATLGLSYEAGAKPRVLYAKNLLPYLRSSCFRSGSCFAQELRRDTRKWLEKKDSFSNVIDLYSHAAHRNGGSTQVRSFSGYYILKKKRLEHLVLVGMKRMNKRSQNAGHMFQSVRHDLFPMNKVLIQRVRQSLRTKRRNVLYYLVNYIVRKTKACKGNNSRTEKRLQFLEKSLIKTPWSVIECLSPTDRYHFLSRYLSK